MAKQCCKCGSAVVFEALSGDFCRQCFVDHAIADAGGGDYYTAYGVVFLRQQDGSWRNTQLLLE